MSKTEHIKETMSNKLIVNEMKNSIKIGTLRFFQMLVDILQKSSHKKKISTKI